MTKYISAFTKMAFWIHLYLEGKKKLHETLLELIILMNIIFIYKHHCYVKLDKHI